jgi:hypothetical protein
MTRSKVAEASRVEQFPRSEPTAVRKERRRTSDGGERELVLQALQQVVDVGWAHWSIDEMGDPQVHLFGVGIFVMKEGGVTRLC